MSIISSLSRYSIDKKTLIITAINHKLKMVVLFIQWSNQRHAELARKLLLKMNSNLEEEITTAIHMEVSAKKTMLMQN